MDALEVEFSVPEEWLTPVKGTPVAKVPTTKEGKERLALSQGVTPDAQDKAEPAPNHVKEAFKEAGKLQPHLKEAYFIGGDGQLYKRTGETELKNLISPRSTLHTFKQAFPALAAQVSAEKFLKAILDLGTDARMVPPGKR